MRTTLTIVSLLTLTAGACNRSSAQNEAPADDARVCTVAAAARPIATEVRETSGLARSRVNPDVFWTHNDSGNEPVLFALGQDGKIRTRIPVRNVTVTDWEDLEAAPCDGQNCLYLADIGDNPAARKHITIYEVLEPSLNDREASVKRAIQATYPDGAQDAEAFFRLPNGNMYIVTKGRHKSIKLYQLGLAGANGQTTLQLIRELLPRPQAESGRVTAATSSPAGSWVAIRTYGMLYVYRTAELLGGGAPALTQSLTHLREKQGESITLEDDGTIWLTSEAERQEDEPTMISLRCVLPR